jgi:CRP-like cAMP-binding protein
MIPRNSAAPAPDLRLIRALRTVPLFSCCSDNEFAAIAGFSRFVIADQDTRLFDEGDDCDAFFFVHEGLVELYKTIGGDKRKVVEFIGAGQTFAEAAVFARIAYPVTAVTVIPSQLVRVNAGAFRRFLETHTDVQSNMLAALSMRLHQLVTQITELSLLSAEQRVAAYLLEHRDTADPNGPVGHMPYRRKDLASRLNVTPETLCRVLGHFRKRGWISMPSNSRLLIHDVDALKGLQAGNA